MPGERVESDLERGTENMQPHREEAALMEGTGALLGREDDVSAHYHTDLTQYRAY